MIVHNYFITLGLARISFTITAGLLLHPVDNLLDKLRWVPAGLYTSASELVVANDMLMPVPPIASPSKQVTKVGRTCHDARSFSIQHPALSVLQTIHALVQHDEV